MADSLSLQDILNAGAAEVGGQYAAQFMPGEGGLSPEQIKKQIQESLALYRQGIGQQQTMATQQAGVETTRAGQDYQTAMDTLRQSQHLQGVMKRAELADRGVGAGEGSIGRSAMVQQGEAQQAQGKGLETWRTRKLEDIGTNLQQRQAELLQQQRQQEMESERALAPLSVSGRAESNITGDIINAGLGYATGGASRFLTG